jgi:hypothetical protein
VLREALLEGYEEWRSFAHDGSQFTFPGSA